MLIALLFDKVDNDLMYAYYMTKSFEYNTDKKQEFRIDYQFPIINLIYQKKIKEAETLFYKCIEKFPITSFIDEDQILAYVNLAKIFIKNGNYTPPTLILDQLLALGSDKVGNTLSLIQSYRANLYIHLKDYEKARYFNNEALNDNNPVYYTNRVIMLENDILIKSYFGDLNKNYDDINKLMSLRDSLANQNSLISFLMLSSIEESDRILYEFEKTQVENTFQREIIEKDKLIKWILYSLVSILTIFIIALFLFLRNLKKQKNEILRQRNQIEKQALELQQNNKLKDMLFSLIGHELRSPFVQLIGILDVKKHLSKLETALPYIEDIHEKAQNIYQTLDNILNWSVTQFKSKSEPTLLIFIENIIQEAIDNLEEKRTIKNIAIYENYEKVSLRLTLKPSQIIIKNILHNAIKFTPIDGNIYLNSFREDNFYVLVIKDSGNGFPVLHDLTHIQNSTEGTSGELGTGIGLFICNDLITKMGGKLIIKNNSGGEVYIYFPII